VSFWASPGHVAEKMTIYLARDLTAGDATPMEDERIEVAWFRPAELDRMIATGEIQDAKTVIGALVWQKFRRRSGAKLAADNLEVLLVAPRHQEKQNEAI
jgi:ADP-ribose pyrophosphatase